MSGKVALAQEDARGGDDPQANKKALAAYFTRVLSTLGLNLENKAEMYSEPCLKAIFLLNNYNYIHMSLQRLLVSLHDKGRDVLEREVRVLLSKHSRPVNPMLMLDLLGLDEELPHEDMGIDVHLPNKVLSDLGAISQWLVTRTDRLDFMNAYATIRAETLYRSIVALKDHQKSSSGSSRSMNIPHSPGRIRPTKETPTKRGSKRGYMYSNFMKKATMAKHAIYSLSADPGRMKASVPEDEQTSVDVVPYLTILSAFVKLAQEQENLTMLQESLAKSDTLTTNMVSILTSFENRLLQLEETILPVYEETGNLQRRQHNIEQTLSLLDHALNFHNTAREVESVIEGAQPSDDLAAYLECMERLASAIKYFGENNPDSLELSTVVCGCAGATPVQYRCGGVREPHVCSTGVGVCGSHTCAVQVCKYLPGIAQDSRSLSLPYKPTDKLKDRDRQLIKDKFTAFNKEMEEIARAQKGFAIPDRELRDSLRAENTQLVLPLYETFLQRYSQYQFTKNNEKYIKYTAEDVRKELGSFFDIAA
ncbi:PREDICTED: exocyst complex component 7-like [Priapulus caudatus]|uniref:Exocyst complex component 7 n=1 Tax=Priapulus caudatus TaxID=37621 RepID=A0ABM1E8W0_PRICU|nr:PREDICTED: exocyst complex component 7-like [Priapulus caudatus]